MTKIKKGNWVEFTMKGVTYQAIVVKGGAKLTVHFDLKKGTARVVTAPAHMFKLIPTHNMDVSGIMDGYELKAYKEAGGEETIRFEAKLYKDGKHIAVVSNNGIGGCDDYYPTAKGTREDIKEFYARVRAWATYYGEVEPFEPETNWIDWINTAQPLGFNSKQYWEQTREIHEEWNEKMNK